MIRILTVPSIALTFLQGATPAQPLNVSSHSETYAVYAAVLGSLKPPVVVMRETERPTLHCAEFVSGLSGAWREVAQDFRDRNARTWLLQAGAPLGFEYRLISKAEILADDARLAKKYPIPSNAYPPGSIEYVAVSAVGFNAARTKALIYFRKRTSGLEDAAIPLIRTGGTWVRDPNSLVCGGES